MCICARSSDELEVGMFLHIRRILKLSWLHHWTQPRSRCQQGSGVALLGSVPHPPLLLAAARAADVILSELVWQLS